MTITAVYKKFSVAPNLIEHMLSVTKIVKVLQLHWTGVVIDWQALLLASLVHDVGNIVKFDFIKYPQFLGTEQGHLDYWKETQKQMISKYGADDHIATGKIMAELGFDSRLIKVIQDKSFGNSETVAAAHDWPAKILAYADLRVLPQGIGSLDERIADVKVRMPKYTSRKDFPELVKAVYQIETQLQAVVDLPLDRLAASVHELKDQAFLDMVI
jgi:hypothetical protein